jgi:hypothetical protein
VNLLCAYIYFKRCVVSVKAVAFSFCDWFDCRDNFGRTEKWELAGFLRVSDTNEAI